MLVDLIGIGFRAFGDAWRRGVLSHFRRHDIYLFIYLYLFMYIFIFIFIFVFIYI